MDSVSKPGVDPTPTLAIYFSFPNATTLTPVWQHGFHELEQVQFGIFERHYARAKPSAIQRLKVDQEMLLAVSRQWVARVIAQVGEYERVICEVRAYLSPKVTQRS